MPTIELSDAAYQRLIFLSAQIGHPMERHCAEWVEARIMEERADSEIAVSYFSELVEAGAMVPQVPFWEDDLIEQERECECDYETEHAVRLAIGYGVSTGRLRDTRDGYVLAEETLR